MHETLNNKVSTDKVSKDPILSNQLISGPFLDVASLSLATEDQHNLQEYPGEILNVLYHRNI